MAETSIGIVTAAAPSAPTRSRAAVPAGSFVPRLLAGAVILLGWEIVVRAIAPAYVAKPSTVALAIPRVLTDPEFLQGVRRDTYRRRRRPGDHDRRRHRHRPADGPQRHR